MNLKLVIQEDTVLHCMMESGAFFGSRSNEKGSFSRKVAVVFHLELSYKALLKNILGELLRHKDKH